MSVVLFSLISHFSDACSLDYIVILFSCPKIILSCCFPPLIWSAGEERSRGMQPTFKGTPPTIANALLGSPGDGHEGESQKERVH